MSAVRRARLSCLAISALAIASAASAQDLRGTVVDSATRLPIPGAVVVLLDAAGTTVARNITNERGQYRVAAPLGARRMRVLRMGFRPREVPVALTAPGAQPLDVAMVSIATMLEEVRVLAGPSCPRRSDRRAALALLEQARAGLLTSVVAREANPASMMILAFERTMDRGSDRIERQTVTMKSSGRVTTSFHAVRSAREFVRLGFAMDSADTRLYFGPDADVLLDDAFSAGYCFHLREPNRARPNQVGLAFLAPNRRRDRVDIDGTLWIDTVARELRELEYRYVGLAPNTDAIRPSGYSSFWEMANGVVFIDRWFLRLPVAVYDTSYSQKNEMRVRQWFFARENGGEVALAEWKDGHSYQAPLGILNGRAVDANGKGVTGIVVRLAGTDYVASPDSLGFFEMTNLLPGPYVATVIHPELAPVDIIIPTAFRFVAVRDSIVQENMLVPAVSDYVRTRCSPDAFSYVPDPLLVVKVETSKGKPVNGARWQLSKDNGISWQRVIESRTTGPDGIVRHCMKLQAGEHVEIRVWPDGDEFPRIGIAHVGRRGGTTFTMTLPSR